MKAKLTFNSCPCLAPLQCRRSERSGLEQVRILGKIGPVDFDLLHWSVLLVCLDQAQLLDHLHSALDPAKDGVLAVQPWCRSERYEELGSVCIGSRVCHAENASARVLQCWGYFVLELLAIDGCAAPSGACGVTTLDHEVGYYAVEYEAVEVVTLGEGREVLACLWRIVVVEFDDNGTLIESAVGIGLKL